MIKSPQIYLVFFVLVFFAAACNKNDQTQHGPDAGAGREIMVFITDHGFEPKSVDIAKGGRITFINKAETGHWPASDYHPTHSLYPEFDPKQPIMPKEQWSFVFQKAGQWEYHDHLYPYLLGRISVK